MTRFFKAALLALSPLALAGCIEGEVQLGDGTTTSSNDVDVWQGYIENYKFLSGSDAVTVRLDAPQGTSVTGTVRFGSGADLPPATDPDVGYPPGLVDEGKPGRTPQEGFDFTLENGVLEPDRLRFSITGGEVWNTWCSLQTPILSEGATPEFYGCLPNWYTIDPCTAGGVPVDCAKMELCLFAQTCSCDASGCVGAGAGKLDFDIKLDGDEAHGSVEGLDVKDVYNVWLTAGGN